MGLGIYLTADASSVLSTGDTFDNPFALTFDGRTGGNKQVRLYVRNDDNRYYYENIQVGLVDYGAENIINQPAEGFSWKLIPGDTQPTENDWRNTAPAVTIDLPDVGSSGSPDISTFLPFWIFIEVPPGLDVGTFDDVKFTLIADEVLA